MATASKDGKLAVALQKNAKVNIYVLGSGRALRAVTNGVYDADPAWDPSSNRIAYVSLVKGDSLALRFFNVEDGSDVELLRERLISQPQWSHDGRHLFFLKGDPGRPDIGTICTLDLASKEVRPIARIGRNRPQSWSLLADGETLCYVTKGSVCRRQIDKGPAQLLPIKVTNPCMVAGSPDAKLLFICDSLETYDKLGIIMDLATGRSEILHRSFMRHELWSPSGRRLAIADVNETYVFDAGTSPARLHTLKQVQTLPGIGVCWRSDSRLVLIRPNMRAPHRLEEVDVQSGKATELYPKGR